MTDRLDTKVYAYISGAWVRLLDIDNIYMSWGLEDSRVSDIDELRLVLNNSTGLYSPGLPSALTGWDEGLLVKLEETFDNLTNVRFLGRISEISIPSEVRDIHVNVTVLGWMDNAIRYPMKNPSLLTNATIDQGFSQILASVPVQPQKKNISVGTFVFDRLFDDTREKTTAYAEIIKFYNSEVGRAYVRHDGSKGETLTTESFESRNGTKTITKITQESSVLIGSDGYAVLSSGGDVIIGRSVDTMPTLVEIKSKNVRRGKDIVNNYDVIAYPKKIDTSPVLIYESDEPLYLSAGEERTISVYWTDPTGKRKINAVPPSGDGGVVALCHFDLKNVVGGGLNGAGVGVGGHFVDETGKALIDHDAPYISFSKFGDGSAYFDGSSAWLEYPYSPDWNFGSGNFTIKFWAYSYATTANLVIVSRDASMAFPPFVVKSNGTNYTISLSSNGVSFDIANGVSMGSITINTLDLYEATRYNGTLYTFKNGTLVSTASASGTLQTSTANLFLGKNHLATWFGGNLDDFFVTKGRALHTASYTADTEEQKMLDGLYWEASTNSTFTGTNVKDKITFDVVYGTEGAKIKMTNTHTAGAYIYSKIYGYGIYSNSSATANVKDGDSILARGEKSVTLSQPYQVTTSLGELDAKRTVELWRNPRTVLKSISYIPNTSNALMRAYLSLDVGDLIPIQITIDDIDSNYYIQSIKSDMKRGDDLIVTYGLEQAWTLEKGLSHVACEFSGATDALEYGHIPYISSDFVTHLGFSAWIYLDAITNSRDQMFMGTGYDYNVPGSVFYVDNSATDVLLSFFTSRYSGGGKWSCPANCFSVGTWTHVFAQYDNSSALNDPKIYVNGVSQTITENNAPSGTFLQEKGAPFILGNSKGRVSVFGGKIKDARVYNMSQSSLTGQQLATALYSAGAGYYGNFEGMKFIGPIVRTDELTAYTNLTLTDEKILDGYNGLIGTPSGSPTIRAI